MRLPGRAALHTTPGESPRQSSPGNLPDLPRGATLSPSRRCPTSEATSLFPEALRDRFPEATLLGEGSFGRVFRARDAAQGDWVAIKLLRAELREDQEVARRFQREVRVGRSLSSPHLLAVRGAGEVEGQPFLVTRFVSGPTLEGHRRLRGGRIVEGEALELFEQLLRGIRDLHAHGVVHRDLKPANMILEEGRRLVLLDLGLARRAVEVEKVTATGMILGTPAYMAPDQLLGRPLRADWDLYAAGLILLEMLRGELPFPGEDLREGLDWKLVGPGERDLRGLSGPLGEYLGVLLTPDAANTFPDAERALQALEQLRSRGEPFVSGGGEAPSRPGPGARTVVSHDLPPDLGESPASRTLEGSSRVPSLRAVGVRPAGAGPGGGARVGTGVAAGRPASVPGAPGKRRGGSWFWRIAILGVAFLSAAAWILTPGAAPPPPDAGVVDAAPSRDPRGLRDPSLQGDWESLRERLEASDPVLYALSPPGTRSSPPVWASWEEGRAAFREIAGPRLPDLLRRARMEPAPIPVALFREIAEVSRVHFLLENCRPRHGGPQPPTLLPPPASTWLSDCLGQAIEVVDFPAFSGEYEDHPEQVFWDSRELLNRNQAQWADLHRSFRVLEDVPLRRLEPGEEIRHGSGELLGVRRGETLRRMTVRNGTGGLYEDGGNTDTLSSTGRLYVARLTGQEGAIDEIKVDLAPLSPGQDLVLATWIHGFVETRQALLEVSGANWETVVFPLRYPAEKRVRGEVYWRSGILVRIPAAFLPEGPERLRITAQGLLGVGDPSATVSLGSLFQHLRGPLPKELAGYPGEP